MDSEQTTNSTSQTEKPKVVSISAKRKRIAKLPWVDSAEEKPPELELILMAYFEYDEDDETEDWFYSLGFYDSRDFWISKEETLMPAPVKWLLIKEPA